LNVEEAAKGILAAVGPVLDAQTDLPRLARDPGIATLLDGAIKGVDSHHQMTLGDARDLSSIPSTSVHLVVTSPPYWTLKAYNEAEGQLGHVREYESFLDELDRVWREVFRILTPGGRLVCVVGDVCLSRRRNNGRHTVVPLHASIAERCRSIGFDGLAPIIWHKIANAVFEANGNGSGFLGKPYEPNAVIKNDVEFILLQRKPGGYRSPTLATRLVSLIPAEHHRVWFQQIWSGVGGASTRYHPAPFPTALASRLIRMFSFVGDTVLDPFVGTGTTTLAAAHAGRNSIGVEIDPIYLAGAVERIRGQLPDAATLETGRLLAPAVDAA